MLLDYFHHMLVIGWGLLLSLGCWNVLLIRSLVVYSSCLRWCEKILFFILVCLYVIGLNYNQHSETLNTFRAAWFRRFSQKNSSFRLRYQCPSSSVHCARELFSGSNGSASLVDCTRKKSKKNVFWMQSTRLADSFELLNSSLVQSVEELGSW